MTPAINLVKQKKIDFQIHEYTHDSNSTSYGLEAAEKLGISVEQVFKTLVVETAKGKLAVGIVPVSATLNMKNLAKALKAKKVAMANAQKAERTTGYVLGGVSPLGQKKTLPTVLDQSAHQFKTIFVSAGRRGLEIELSPRDLLKLTRGTCTSIASA